MKTKFGVVCIVVVSAAFALIGAGSASGTVATVVPYPKTSRIVAEEWVREVGGGDEAGVCLLEPTGPECSVLPTSEPPLSCPRGEKVGRRKPFRTTTEQIGEITEEAPGRVYAVVFPQKKGSKARGALGLELQSGSWVVTYLRQGPETFVPAGSVWNSEAWPKLWIPRTCLRRKS